MKKTNRNTFETKQDINARELQMLKRLCFCDHILNDRVQTRVAAAIKVLW